MANLNKPIKILEKMERRRIQRLPKFFGYPLLSQERVKLRTLYRNILRPQGRSEQKAQKPMKNVGNSSRGRSQGVMNIFRAPYTAHCAVIFATAQLSCITAQCTLVHLRGLGIACRPSVRLSSASEVIRHAGAI